MKNEEFLSVCYALCDSNKYVAPINHEEILQAKKPAPSDHEQAIKMNAAFDKRQRKNSKRVKS